MLSQAKRKIQQKIYRSESNEKIIYGVIENITFSVINKIFPTFVLESNHLPLCVDILEVAVISIWYCWRWLDASLLRSNFVFSLRVSQLLYFFDSKFYIYFIHTITRMDVRQYGTHRKWNDYFEFGDLQHVGMVGEVIFNYCLIEADIAVLILC